MKLLVTGGSGFVGHHVLDAALARGHRVTAPTRAECDLVSAQDPLGHWIRRVAPDAVIHLAGVVGGIGANRKRPADFWYENLAMGAYVLHAAHAHKIPKLVMIGTTCSYPKFPPRIPFREEDLWAGYPEETNAPYGVVKRALIVGAQAYREQYGLNAITLIPTNLYGPHEHFDLENSHVIPTMIRKMHEAKESSREEVTLWGSGTPTRDFVYAPDVAQAILLATETYDGAEPVNLGSGCEVTMRELAKMVAGVVRYEGVIEWDASKPDGQPRRCLDTSRAREFLGWQAEMPLDHGLAHTYRYFLEQS